VRWKIVFLAVIVSVQMARAAQSGAADQTGPKHDRQFWRDIVKARFAVPAGQQIFPLLRELSTYVGSNDPELRDDLAYTITDVWIKYQKDLSAEQLNILADEWRANLRERIGESGNDSVLKRSFSALCLASLAERDLKIPFLGEQRYRQLLESGLAYLKDERDLRGFDPVLGWIHASAHTADLLAAIAENSLLHVDDQLRMLEAVATRLSSAHQIFTYGEQDRLARVAATIALRKDCDTANFEKWLSSLDESDLRAFKDAPPKIDLLQTFENDTYMLRGLGLYLWSAKESANPSSRDAVMKILRQR
jgi:Protein of unknown function (DUF2785).